MSQAKPWIFNSKAKDVEMLPIGRIADCVIFALQADSHDEQEPVHVGRMLLRASIRLNWIWR
jgi:hypothetical protein